MTYPGTFFLRDPLRHLTGIFFTPVQAYIYLHRVLLASFATVTVLGSALWSEDGGSLEKGRSLVSTKLVGFVWLNFIKVILLRFLDVCLHQTMGVRSVSIFSDSDFV